MKKYFNKFVEVLFLKIERVVVWRGQKNLPMD